MLASDVAAAYLAEYREEHGRRPREAARERDQLERRLAEAERNVVNLVAEIAARGNEIAEIRAALATVKKEAAANRQRLAISPRSPLFHCTPASPSSIERPSRSCTRNSRTRRPARNLPRACAI